MKLTLLGTGGPEQNRDRLSQSSLLEVGGQRILVDAGRGAINQLTQVGVMAHQIDQILITHHHYDHIGDLGVLLLSAWAEGRNAAVSVVGPPGTQVIVDALFRTVYSPDIRWRQAENDAWLAMREPGALADEWTLGDPDKAVEVTEIVAGLVPRDRGIVIRAAESEHGRTYLQLADWHSVAYRVETEGLSIVFSGDTALNNELVELARGADVLVLNCYASEAEVKTSWSRVFSTTMIASSRECGRIAAAAGVGKLVLSHFGAHMTFDSVEADVCEHYAGPIVIGADLMEIEL